MCATAIRPLRVPPQRSDDLPPLRVHHLLYFLGVAAVASAMQHGAQRPPAPASLGRELQEMASWLGATLGAAMWALGLWWCTRGRRFLHQPGPWLVLAALVDAEFPARLATVCERLVIGGDGRIAELLHASWYGRAWAQIPSLVAGLLLAAAAAAPQRAAPFGPLWRLLLALVAAQALAGVFVGPWSTPSGRWQGWRLASWEARARGGAALAAAAVLRDATLGRRRHWSHALCVALWMGILLGRHAALSE